jgi:DNA-binding CsgD family transcriptional regulator
MRLVQAPYYPHSRDKAYISSVYSNSYYVSEVTNMDKWLMTKREEELLLALTKFATVKAAAQSIGMASSTAYNHLANIREKHKVARGYVNKLLGLKRRSKLCNLVLTPRPSMKD